MARLAESYGISGNGLAKICQRLNVPYPPRGYWAKKAAGKKVISYRLPEAKADTPDDVTIYPTPPSVVPPRPAPEIQEKMEAAKIEAGEISVPEKLLRPHAIIAGWLEDHNRSKREARQETNPMLRRLRTPSDLTPLEHRQHRILHALFKALERLAAKIKEGERKELYVEVLGERIEFQLREKQRQVRRRLTAEERQRSWRQNQEWTQERQMTGKLQLLIKTSLPGELKAEWLETDEKPMETLLSEIVGVFIAAGPLLVERRKAQEEEARRQQLAERQRYEEAQRRKRDSNRWRRFIQYAQKQEEADLARAFLERVKTNPASSDVVIEDKTITEWITWAEAKIAEADVVSLGAEAIFRDVAAIQSWTYHD